MAELFGPRVFCFSVGQKRSKVCQFWPFLPRPLKIFLIIYIEKTDYIEGEQIEYLYQNTWRPGVIAGINPVGVHDVHTDKSQEFDDIRKVRILGKDDVVPYSFKKTQNWGHFIFDDIRKVRILGKDTNLRSLMTFVKKTQISGV